MTAPATGTGANHKGDEPTENSTAQASPEPEPLPVTSHVTFFKWLVKNVGTDALPGFYERDGELVFVPEKGSEGYQPLTDNKEDDDGPAQVRPVDVAKLRSAIAHRYVCTRITKQGPEEVLPPFDPANLYVAGVSDPANALPRLRGVVHSPYLRKDGTVVTTPGFDQETGLLYRPPRGLLIPGVPDVPTAWEVKEAVDQLLDLVDEFPWVEKGDLGTYVLHFFVAPLLRVLLPRPYPAAAIDAHQAGSGKTLLAKLGGALHGAVMRSELRTSEEEVRKAVTSMLRTTTAPLVVLDNVTGRFSSGQMAALLTMSGWQDRALGTNTMVDATNDRLWVITGNNLNLGGDLPRRFPVWVKIDPDQPDPHMRNGFKHPDLLHHVQEHRGPLLRAALVLARHWVMEGKPQGGPERHDDFGTFLRSLAGLHELVGLPGEFAAADLQRSRVGEYSEDDEIIPFLRALHEWKEGGPFRAKEIIEVVALVAAVRFEQARYDAGNSFTPSRAEVEPVKEMIADHLPSELGGKTGQSLSVSLGKWLGSRVGKWSGSYVLRKASKEDRAGNSFKVEHRGEDS